MMTRRQLMLTLAAAAALAACGDNKSAKDDKPTATPAGEARSEVARAAAGSPVGVGTSMTALALDLHRRIATKEGGNLVFSPASVVFALAMTRNGARGTTATEMDAVLRSTGAEVLNASLNAVDQALATRSGERQGGYNRTDTVELALANALWLQTGMDLEPVFLDALGAFYGAGANQVDYIGDAKGARKVINAWVSDRTKTRIPELLPDGVLDEQTRLVLTNAIYLKASWDQQFEKNNTRDGAFTTLAGPKVTVPFMSQNLRGAYAKGEGWEAVELPYLGRELAMTIVVPAAGTYASFEQALTPASVDAIVTALQPGEIRLLLPTWTNRTKAGLAEHLAALGMPTAFDLDRADFSGITAAERLFISAVIHEAFIAVDETGTEAAAATAVVIVKAAAPASPPTELTVDRPFLYLIRDLPTGTPLFMGRVADPTQK